MEARALARDAEICGGRAGVLVLDRIVVSGVTYDVTLDCSANPRAADRTPEVNEVTE